MYRVKLQLTPVNWSIFLKIYTPSIVEEKNKREILLHFLNAVSEKERKRPFSPFIKYTFFGIFPIRASFKQLFHFIYESLDSQRRKIRKWASGRRTEEEWTHKRFTGLTTTVWCELKLLETSSSYFQKNCPS